MKQLWAPWRMTYLRGETKPPGNECVFCIGEEAEEDRRRWILRRGEYAFVIMNRFPYTNGHLMVTPYRHVSEIGELTHEEGLEIHRLLVLCRKVLGDHLSPQGFNIGMNLGEAAGAGIADHIHVHIVPRWCGDTNFMPVFNDIRVIPQHLEETYNHLLKAFSEFGD